MVAIRKRRNETPWIEAENFEGKVTRVFDVNCAGIATRLSRERLTEAELFYRPMERAGEVWAARTDVVDYWLTRQSI
jgi:hypothetical protein